VTPLLDSIEHKFNSKSIKFPKVHKVPTLEAININKPWSEWKERFRNFGVKPPKRGIELGWVTRGTRPKKPSSSRGFAHEAYGAWGAWGAWGSWGLKSENRTFFSSVFQQATTKIKIKIKNNFLFLFFFERPRRIRADAARPCRVSERVQGGDASARTRVFYPQVTL
jgi:hypothetical protein